MVCDFLVYTYLEIKHKEGGAYVELNRRHDWYCDCLEPTVDSDDEEDNYRIRCEEYYESFLKPSFEPILIYDGKKFLRHSYLNKYWNVIYEKLESIKYWRDVGTLLNMEDIQRVCKIEIREKSSN